MLSARHYAKAVDANNYLKRSFAQVAGPKSLYIQDVQCDIHNTAMSVQMLNEHNNRPRIAPTKRRSSSLSRSEIPAQPASPSLSSSFPSFMSTIAAATAVTDGSSCYYNEGREKSCLGPRITMDAGVSTVATSTPSASATSTAPTKPTAIVHGLYRPTTAGSTTLNPPQIPYQFLPRENLSIASGSTDSSPTTTISTFDSPVVQDASPSSSPESPSSVTPLPSLKPMTRLTNGDRLAAQLSSESRFRSNQPFSVHHHHHHHYHHHQQQQQQQPESPTRRARNLKNLSLKLPPTASSRQAIATAPIRGKTPNISAPASPIQLNTRSLRRKPPNLTIQTPSFDSSFSSNIPEVVPPTPNIRPALRHIESSPSLNSILSPTAPCKPSLALPSSFFQSSKRPMPGAWEDRVSPDRPSPSTQHILSGREALQELVEEEDNLASRESRKGSDKGYPEGPILIYDTGLYLYLEPSCEEAIKFDVVINVAKEVANPFRNAEPKQDTIVSVWKATLPNAQRQSVVEPDTALSEMSFKSAFEFQPAGTDSPTTPKRRASEPEYIHVPWDHNSEILDDLYPLCEMIDERILQGKKVLIHCQLGVSRSASLVIAYGLYKNPDKDFNDIYSIVKARSSWVGPNMSLIYQLTDFRSRVQQRGPSRPPPAEWFDGSSDTKMTTAQQQPKVQGSSSSTSKPQRPPVPLFDAAADDSKHSTTHPFTNPFTNPFSWTSPQTSSAAATSSSTTTTTSQQRRNVSPRPLPLREKYQTIHSLRRPRYDNTTIPSHRTLSRTSVHQMDLVMQDVPATPSLFSPRAAEFWTTPFSHTRSVAGDLACRLDNNTNNSGSRTSIEAMSPVVRGCLTPPPGAADPRSPPQQRREPVIMRNIDEFL
ncbi:tyrosine-protein phosphatase [[Emmonsia] crescens]|uniref:protein-tyrosine-phosphatase n=1 Tax=[Emmonsia] crescens TaxID=73230 RepID=A0A2B7ZGS6_9EURO|nr:tyrosine-protein phosphatase [Emmonsia crescens]